MRIHGKKIEGLNIEEIIIPRGEDCIVFKAQAIADYEECEGLNPRPKPKKGRNRQGELVELTGDSNFQLALDQYASRRVGYMVAKSLLATEGFEWETIDLSNPDTWDNWRKEFLDSNFTEPEISRIFAGVMAACGLDEAKVQKARERFLAGRQAESERLSSQRDDLSNTPSGELVSDSE